MADAMGTASGTETGRRVEKSAEAFRTISEVADELEIPQHVLRFWESKFSQVKPLKRGGGRRYYRPEDIVLLRSIRTLLYNEGYTIKGVQKLLREGQVGRTVSGAGGDREKRHDLNAAQRREINAIIDELADIKRMLGG
ncbi:MAG TPA: MerR family transcriptional regulator [Alphaproteobacteria bacterium]|nr:MerR family transcriptional regulator [Alphaproteobacteria bacterium]